MLRGRDVGRLFHLAKRYAGASQHRIATATGVPQSRVNALMNGRCGPVTSIEVLERIADGLNLPDHARASMGLAARHYPTNHYPTNRPPLVPHLPPASSPRLTAGSYDVLVMRTGPDDLAERDRLAGHVVGEQVVAVSPPLSGRMDPPGAGQKVEGCDAAGDLDRALRRRGVSEEAVHALEDIVVLLRRLDDEIGPGPTIGTVMAHLTSVSGLLMQTTPTDNAFVSLSRVSAGLSQLAGWLSFDLNDSDRARRHLAVAYRAAIASGDRLLAAYALSWQAVVLCQEDPDAGLALTSAARRCAGADAPSSVHAWLARVEAEESAGRGDRYAAEEALDKVADRAARPRTERDPAWTYFLDDSQITAYRGVCYVRLGLGRQAEAALTTALHGLPGSFVRDRCLYLTYLSAAYVLQRQPEAAAQTAAHALPLAVRTESLRSIQRLARIGDALAEWSELPEIQQFQDLMITHRYA